tara:strand:- start:264 stop:830 length:567 start_codon:yes stop_codon:yes gene_type:complete
MSNSGYMEKTVFRSSEDEADLYPPSGGMSHEICDPLPKKTFISCISDFSKMSRLNMFEKFEKDTQTFKDEVEKVHNHYLKILNEEHRSNLFKMIETHASRGENRAVYKFSWEDLKKLRHESSKFQEDNSQLKAVLGSHKQIIMNWLFTLKDPNLEKSLDGFIINVFKQCIPDDEYDYPDEYTAVSLLW